MHREYKSIRLFIAAEESPTIEGSQPINTLAANEVNDLYDKKKVIEQ